MDLSRLPIPDSDPYLNSHAFLLESSPSMLRGCSGVRHHYFRRPASRLFFSNARTCLLYELARYLRLRVTSSIKILITGRRSGLSKSQSNLCARYLLSTMGGQVGQLVKWEENFCLQAFWSLWKERVIPTPRKNLHGRGTGGAGV